MSPKALLLEMGGLVQDQLRRATRALLEGDHAAARHAIALDRDVDELELRVDEAGLRLLARHAAATVDPRTVAAAMKAGTDLERIGDHACTIARRALAPAPPALVRESGLAAMTALVRTLLADSLEALARDDALLARKVIDGEPALASLEKRVLRALLADAGRAPAILSGIFRLVSAARSLERIAGHAARIAEMVIYASAGERAEPRHAACVRPA